MTATRSIRSVTLDGAPAIPGLEARYFRDASDFERLAELTSAASLEDGIPYLPTAQNLQVEMDAADGANPVDDVVFVEVDGRVVAAAGVERVVRDVPNYQIWGTVHPDVRRRGLGTALLGWNLARARVRASREDPLVRVELATFSEDSEVGQRVLLGQAGFKAVRHFFLMRRQGLDDIPDAPLPDGIEIRPVLEDQWRTIVAAENEAFRDHWGHREMGEGDFTRTFGRAELDTSLWVVAWDGDQVAGVVQNWIWPEENERSRRQARLARAHQRPAAVAPSRSRPGDHRGVAGQASRGRDGRSDARRRFGEPERGARAVRGAGLRPEESRGGLPARPGSLTRVRRTGVRRRGRAPSRRARVRSS